MTEFNPTPMSGVVPTTPNPGQWYTQALNQNNTTIGVKRAAPGAMIDERTRTAEGEQGRVILDENKRRRTQGVFQVIQSAPGNISFPNMSSLNLSSMSMPNRSSCSSNKSAGMKSPRPSSNPNFSSSFLQSSSSASSSSNARSSSTPPTSFSSSPASSQSLSLSGSRKRARDLEPDGEIRYFAAADQVEEGEHITVRSRTRCNGTEPRSFQLVSSRSTSAASNSDTPAIDLDTYMRDFGIPSNLLTTKRPSKELIVWQPLKLPHCDYKELFERALGILSRRRETHEEEHISNVGYSSSSSSNSASAMELDSSSWTSPSDGGNSLFPEDLPFSSSTRQNVSSPSLSSPSLSSSSSSSSSSAMELDSSSWMLPSDGGNNFSFPNDLPFSSSTRQNASSSSLSSSSSSSSSSAMNDVPPSTPFSFDFSSLSSS